MNDQPQSPPKRITRARAAAKTTDAGVKTTRIATASAKAKLIRTTSVSASTSTSRAKRKTRADDVQEHEEEHGDMDELAQPQPTRTTRGRPKKVAVGPELGKRKEEIPTVVRPTRGRPKKPLVDVPASEPPRSTRGRPKKIDAPAEEAIVVEEPPKRAIRTRAATVTKAPARKKTVKFDEPDKENMVPPAPNTEGKANGAQTATGLRARPMRKATVTATRATRGQAKALEEEPEKSSPLSPKKATQIATAKQKASDDELATDENAPMMPLMKSPVKPPGSIFGVSKKLEFSNSLSTHTAMAPATQHLGGSMMSSPARRPPPSPFKDSLRESPQKMTLGDSMIPPPFKPSLPAPSMATNSAFKASLLQSPARRPQSPIKTTEAGSPSRSGNSNPFLAATPKAGTFKMSRFTTPRTVNKSALRANQMGPPPSGLKVASDRNLATDYQSTLPVASPSRMQFSGRLSSIVPREADPAFAASASAVKAAESHYAENEPASEAMNVGNTESVAAEESMKTQDILSPIAPSGYTSGAFNLRSESDNPFPDSDSEDELTSSPCNYSTRRLETFKPSSPSFTSSPSIPTPCMAIHKTPKAAKAQQGLDDLQSYPAVTIGFTPLAQQLNDWMTSTPDKPEAANLGAGSTAPTYAKIQRLSTETESTSPSSTIKNNFFDDEMSVREEVLGDGFLATSETRLPEQRIDEVDLSSAELDEEDLALAHEADDMSLVELDDVELDDHLGPDAKIAEPAMSEASQEYGDENEIPIDPALMAPPLPPVPTPPSFATPKRILSERVCHTVSKVPLKPAAEITRIRPSPKKRSLSISRPPVQRPSSTLQRNNTVISYSPSKGKLRTPAKTPSREVAMAGVSSSQENDDAALWSTLGTPARTPRRDVNIALLSGAVVFVDVHTTEGADASVLFTELLTQMGARCVKTWNWSGKGDDRAKIGITHIVFKDGGRKTLQKAREAGSVVSCVGVGWVLDCERENKWLDESPYAIDTALVPRGGHRRRRSMEPQILANLNGTLVPSSSATPARNYSASPSRESLGLPGTPFTSKSRRRDSVQWVRSSPFSPDDEQEADDQTLLLSPVPVTPAPEAISAYAEHGLYGDETPACQTPCFLQKEQLMQQTAPPAKGRFIQADDEDADDDNGVARGILSEKKDESVMMRLMAARRKSLQWAPKVGSPLARGAAW
ncbi:uncharacterized protein BP5553_09803 [Venustampulla echinocandica]|uniref:BRCT domain-containing protein n=1 Tax=Venustampulla echinocandica TaxID=2656787 RepID=A0A370TAP5_9HELO|nr:uncharacterized protein BP5553_09803 [Venustampulla echinocandica]RDL31014.1 hypothetical protein BP5553_09803 [Venustampulla echinocandica]